MARNVMLDDDQKEIVNSEVNHIVVVAGAGSGKTTVLTERIRNLIEVKGVDPAEMFAITFTNLAADEMRERLKDVKGIDDLFIGTIHSFANAILHQFGEYYDILTDEMFMKVLLDLSKRYCKYLTPERAVGYMALQADVKAGREEKYKLDEYLTWDENREYTMLTREAKYVRPEQTPDYPESVYSYCKKNGIITFDEIIEIAEKHLGDELTLNYLFVDEYQDTGVLEDNFVRHLKAEHLFIVGDDWQSIYGFKGAVVDIFKRYVNRCERDTSGEWKVYHLDRNYRCSQSVLNISNEVIKDDAERLEKKVIGMNKSEGSVKVDNKQEVVWYLNNIRKKYSDDLGSWFLLTRTRKDLVELMKFCEMVGLPAMEMSKEGSAAEVNKRLAENKVKVMTIHAAKGLERTNVLMYGHFPVRDEPSWSILENFAKLSRWYEERRIMYVGTSRAKDKLIILTDGRSGGYGERQVNRNREKAYYYK